MGLGNGLANIIAALIVAIAIIWTGGFSGSNGNGGSGGKNDEAYADWYARAVGDIRNDIVVNCGCCGDEKGNGQRRAANNSF